MPASRSRTERWRDLLQQIMERSGGIEFTIARPAGSTAPDLVWRVRLLALSDSDMHVEQPTAMGRVIPVDPGSEVIGVIVLGQNRWMFRSRTLPSESTRLPTAGLRIAMPAHVERCSRREFLRVATAELHLPHVECWPLLDATSVVAAEAANRALILERERTGLRLVQDEPASPDSPLLPTVGPCFSARLINIGGGGAGLLVTKEEATASARSRMLWVRVALTPQIPAPIAITTRIVHTHIDSEQNLYLGAAFDFAFNPSHRDFVVDQITRYVGKVQSICKAA